PALPIPGRACGGNDREGRGDVADDYIISTGSDADPPLYGQFHPTCAQPTVAYPWSGWHIRRASGAIRTEGPATGSCDRNVGTGGPGCCCWYRWRCGSAWALAPPGHCRYAHSSGHIGSQYYYCFAYNCLFACI